MKGRYLKVKEADDPSVILWQNLGVSQGAQYARKGVTAVVTLILLILCCLIILYGATADERIQDWSPQVECAADVTIEPQAALDDFNLGD